MQETTQDQLIRPWLSPLFFMIIIMSARFFEGHLLFHTLAELFTIVVGVVMAVVAYYAHQFTKNNFLLYLGMGYFWIAALDLFHMLTYKGMMIYPAYDANLTLNFWVLSRLFEALLLLSAPFVNFKVLSKTPVFLLFGAMAGAVYAFSFSPYLLELYGEGSGLTGLKIGFEYVVIALLAGALILYRKLRNHFERFVYYCVLLSISFTMLAELAFTSYVDLYAYTNVLGHLFRFMSYWMIFLAIVQVSLQKPFSAMAQDASTYDAIPLPAVVVDAEGIVRQANRATLSFLSLSKEAVFHRRNHMLFHDVTMSEAKCALCQAIKNGQALCDYELPLGSKTYRFSLSPIYFDNEPSGTIQVCSDISALKNSEANLIRESSLLKTIINTVPIRIFWKDRESRYLGCNRLLAEDAGLRDEEELVGKTDHDMLWHKEAASYVSDDKEVMRTQRSKLNYEEVQSLKDGSKRWLNTSKAPLLDQNGQVEGILGAYFDISERKRAQEKLIRANKLLSNAEQLGHMGSWELDLQTKQLFWSDEVFRIHGEEIGAFVPTLEIFMSYISADDRQKIEEALFFTNVRSELSATHYKLLRKDGSVRSIQIKNEMIFSDSGEAVKLIGILFDETERVASEQELKKLKTAVEQSPVSIIITDLEGSIEYVNPQFSLITGYTFEEAIGKNPRILASGQTSEYKYVHLWNEVAHDKTWSGIFKNIKKSGEAYLESAMISPIKDREGNIVNYIGIGQDITEKVGMRELLKDQEDMMIIQSRHAAMGEMVGMIAHQWRQPLSIISMGANNLLLDIEMEDINAEVFKAEALSIVEQVNHLSQTIDDFRNYFRPDREKESVHVEEVIKEALNIIGKSLESNKVELTLSLGESSPVEIFRRELVQVLINVINNAKEAMVEHCKEQRLLSISTEEVSGAVIIRICDNGGGIDEKIIHRIYEPYFSTKDKQTGTGLGLFMSKTIMEKHLNGRIEAFKNDADGTCFVLSIYKEESL
ncbi:MAG: PAS domain S-box protein [Campylobacterales bacterium]|nr:PAS domain S-box protein [Campylobacterales bacterium]